MVSRNDPPAAAEAIGTAAAAIDTEATAIRLMEADSTFARTLHLPFPGD
jgi:hypothetical protein